MTAFTMGIAQEYFAATALLCLSALVLLLLFRNRLRVPPFLTVMLTTTRKKIDDLPGTSSQAETNDRLNALLARQKAIMKVSVDPMATIDFDGIVLSISDSFETVIGWKREEIVGRNISIIMPEPHRSSHDSYLKNYSDTGKTHILYLTREFSVVRKNGTQFPCELTVSRVNVPGEDDVFFAGTIRDITERCRAEEEKRQLEDQLRQSQKMEAIGTLAGGIAHDFNNLLTAIKGFTELAMLDSPADSTQQENLHEVLVASERAAELVHQILTFSRKGGEEAQVVDLNEMINETLKLLRPTLPSTIDLEITLPDTPTSVLADPTRIHQVLVNLCTNAAASMKKSVGTLTLTLGETIVPKDEATALNIDPGIYFRLDVADTGCGIPPENIERIFDPFFTTKEVGQGTGMGLAVLRSIVKNYRGAVSLETEVDCGSTFSVFLPKSGEPVAEQVAPHEGSTRGHERILLVDDEEMVLRLNKKILSSNGYDVVTTPDGFSAMDRYIADPKGFSLVITDQTMPGLRGDELASSILDHDPMARIILCSGFSDTIDSSEARKMGIRSYITKPIATRQFLRTVRTVLDEG